jgi:hypothetical protein
MWKIVAIIGVPHDDEAPLRSSNATHQGPAIATSCHWHETRPQTCGNRLRTIRATIIRYDDFALYLLLTQCLLGFFNARRQGIRFIQAWHDD